MRATLESLGVTLVERTFVTSGENVRTRLAFSLPTPSRVRATFRREGWTDALVKVFKDGIQTGNTAFDKLVLVTTATPTDTRALLAKAEVRESLGRAIEASMTFVIVGERVVAELVGREPGVPPALRRVIVALVAYLPTKEMVTTTAMRIELPDGGVYHLDDVVRGIVEPRCAPTVKVLALRLETEWRERGSARLLGSRFAIDLLASTRHRKRIPFAIPSTVLELEPMIDGHPGWYADLFVDADIDAGFTVSAKASAIVLPKRRTPLVLGDYRTSGRA